jgi:hypothetical protein
VEGTQSGADAGAPAGRRVDTICGFVLAGVLAVLSAVQGGDARVVVFVVGVGGVLALLDVALAQIGKRLLDELAVLPTPGKALAFSVLVLAVWLVATWLGRGPSVAGLAATFLLAQSLSSVGLSLVPPRSDAR